MYGKIPIIQVNSRVQLHRLFTATIHSDEIYERLRSAVKGCVGWIIASKTRETRSQFWLMDWQEVHEVVQEEYRRLKTSGQVSRDSMHLE
jgi:hypothetical protein